MTYRPPRVLDASALVGFFNGNRRLVKLWEYADNGLLNLLVPTTAIADAQAAIGAGITINSWYVLLLSPGVRSMPLSEHCAIEVGCLPGPLSVRQVVHEAVSMRAAVVTCDRSPYKDFDVHVQVV